MNMGIHIGLKAAKACALGVCMLTMVADAADFGKYQVILDRKPFGEAPLNVAGGAAGAKGGPGAAAPQGSFITELRMCAVTENGNELGVGIENTKSNKTYLFRIGDTIDEITLVDADYAEECALLRKGTEEYWISIKGGTGGQGPGATAASAASGGTATTSSIGAHESYAERLRKRRESMREQVVEPPRLSGEQLQEHLKQYQMDLIRAGGEKGPPLPIPLTPEMDAQLVSEGVLPPVQ
jgi:hypothetical protein